MKFFDWFFTEKWWFYLTDGANKQLILTNRKNSKEKGNRLFFYLVETSSDFQPILCFNIITRSKCYSLFPILSGLVEPSLRNFRIPLLNGLFSPVGIGGLIPSLRTVLESFLAHTARQSTLFLFHLNLPYLTE